MDPAISTLKKVLRRGMATGDYASAVRASIAILDRCGFHPSQSIELTGKNGGPIQTEDLIPVERLSVACQRLMFAELKDGFKISAELEEKLLSEILR